MNEILSLSEEERRHQMETILSYDKEIEVFQSVIDEIMAYLANITVPVNIMYGEEDDPLYAQSAQYIYDNVNSQDKELLKFEKRPSYDVWRSCIQSRTIYYSIFQ